MLYGVSLAKNANRYNYPLERNIKQHVDLFDKWVFIVPKMNQDVDSTAKTIAATFSELNKLHKVEFEHVDWPTEMGFQEEGIDKTLQSRIIRKIEASLLEKASYTWVYKHDIDEFIHEKDFEEIRNMVKVMTASDITAMNFGYKQMLGSTHYSCYDPTDTVNHVVQLLCDWSFPGNDAMNIVNTYGHCLDMSHIITYHCGYLRPAHSLTTKIKEHLVLNKSVYGDTIDREKLENYEFEFPIHKKGARLWPLGIGVLQGQENQIEYYREEDIPRELKNNRSELSFFKPNFPLV